MSLAVRPDVQHDPSASILAIALGLPWSLLMGVLLHPDSNAGILILMVSIGINLSLLAWMARLSSSESEIKLIGHERIARLAKIAGVAATIAWVFLAGITVASTLLVPSPTTLVLTLAVSVLFSVVAAILSWRTSAVVKVCRQANASSATASLLLSDIVTSAAMSLLAVLLITGVVSRVFGEGMPLFG
jgi:hypothetical protein